MNEKYSNANEEQQGQKLCHCDHGHGACTLAHAADVDQYKHTVNTKHDQNAYDRATKKGNNERNRICKNVDHASNRPECGKEIEHPGEKSHVTTERDFHVGIKSACQGDAA